MIGHNEKTTSWGSGVEAMGIGFVRYTLRQHLNKFEVEINRKLFRTATRVAEFDTTDLEQADTATLMRRCASASAAPASRGIIASTRRAPCCGSRRTPNGNARHQSRRRAADPDRPTSNKDQRHEKPAVQPVFGQRQARQLQGRGQRHRAL
jgi:hypothetical protein